MSDQPDERAAAIDGAVRNFSSVWQSATAAYDAGKAAGQAAERELADKRVAAIAADRDYWREQVAAERKRCARLCDDESRIRTEAGNAHPEDSDSRGRCFAAARAAMNCAVGIRGREVV